MSLDPSLALQVACVTLLRADAAVSARCADRIYDSVPAKPVFPYITLGEVQVLEETASCYDGSRCILTLHVWSRKPGFPECKAIADAVTVALQGAEPTLEDHRVVDFARDSARFIRDPDGLTSHGVLTFTVLTEPA